jgi:hypothetical protein
MVMSQRQQQQTATQRPDGEQQQHQQQQRKWNGEQYRRHRERNATSIAATKNRMIVVISTFAIIGCLVCTIVLVSILQPTNAFFSDTRRRVSALTTDGNTTTEYGTAYTAIEITDTSIPNTTTSGTESVHARSHSGIASTETPVVYGVDVVRIVSNETSTCILVV